MHRLVDYGIRPRPRTLRAIAVVVVTAAAVGNVAASAQEGLSEGGDEKTGQDAGDLPCPPDVDRSPATSGQWAPEFDMVPLRTENPQAAEQIRETLSGETADQPSGDPLLDDVLQLIRGRGSVLDGSALDESSDTLPSAPSEMAPRDHAQLAPARSGRSVGVDGSSRYRAAEMLLKAARLLAKEAGSDESRTELVARMRAEAVQLLTQ